MASHIHTALCLGLISNQEPARGSPCPSVFGWMVAKTGSKIEISAAC